MTHLDALTAITLDEGDTPGVPLCMLPVPDDFHTPRIRPPRYGPRLAPRSIAEL